MSSKESRFWDTTPMGQGVANYYDRRPTAPRAVDVMVARELLGSLAGAVSAELAPLVAENSAADVASVTESYAEVVRPDQQ